jgi:YebC/PmpR family DNA-binding regulatory protein
MAGHSHWARIKHKKATTDKRRGKLWSKLARNIIVAARAGGGDPNMNLTLRYAIDKAREANMPNDTIDRAIKRGTGDLDGAAFEEVGYEGYGPKGVAILVKCLTDNRNRTASEIRMAFEKNGATIGAAGCVSWMFDKKGVFIIDKDNATEEQLMEVALDAGASDIETDDAGFEVTCPPELFTAVRQALLDAKIETVSAELTMVPQNRILLEGDDAKKMLKIIDALEDQEDSQDVYSNFDLPDDAVDDDE